MYGKLLGFTVLLAFLISLPLGSTCTPDTRPYFEVRTPELRQCGFISNNENISSDTDMVAFIINRSWFRTVCEGLYLNEEDQSIFRDVISQFNRRYNIFSATYIEKQSASQFSDFQSQVVRANSDLCDCVRYDNVSRRGEWTVYVSSRDCPTSSDCSAIPPEGCLNRYFAMYWVYSIFLVPLTLIGLLFLMIFLVM